MTGAESERNRDPEIPPQEQNLPGDTSAMTPKPDHGEDSYKGSAKLAGRVALITGGDSGIGRAVAIAFAREGADVAISYLSEHDDAAETARWVEKAGRKALTLPGDIGDPAHCTMLVDKTLEAFGKLDVLINNAAYQMSFDNIDEITPEEWDKTFRTNIHSFFYLSRKALKHMKRGAAIVNTASINSKDPSPALLPYATTKGAIANFTAGLAQLVAEKGVRVNAVAPGPVWTPLIPASFEAEKVAKFGENTPLGRPAQPAELAAAYVYLACEDSSYVTGAVLPVTGGRPML